MISSCISRTNALMAQNDVGDTRRKALIFQRRQLQNERNVEEIVQTNTEKVCLIRLIFSLLIDVII